MTDQELWCYQFCFNKSLHLTLTFIAHGGSDGKASACSAGDLGLIPGLGRSPGEGNGNPLQYSYWYYSLGEFVRFSIKHYLYNEEALEKEKSEYLSKASDQELAWYLQNYADAVPLVQIVYIRLITEVECRRERGLHGNNKAADGLYTAVEKLAKRVNISPEEYYEKRIYPIIVNIRTRRIKQFYRFYSGKTLKKLNYF